MNAQNCLEAAMFAAAESYSFGIYELEDCSAEEANEAPQSKTQPFGANPHHLAAA